MKVAVITPYYKESVDILEQCHSSVLSQTHECVHIMVADGFPQSVIDNWNVDHIILPRSHDDIGSTPRLIGCYYAIGLGCTAVTFLDADNCYAEDHIQSLVDLYTETGADFLSSSRYLCRMDLSIMGDCPFTNPNKFIDTNCMMFTTGGFGVLHYWTLMPKYAHLIGDRVILHYVRKANLTVAHSNKPTVYYRCNKEGIYKYFNEPIPCGVAPRPNYEESHDRWIADGNPPLLF